MYNLELFIQFIRQATYFTDVHLKCSKLELYSPIALVSF